MSVGGWQCSTLAKIIHPSSCKGRIGGLICMPSSQHYTGGISSTCQTVTLSRYSLLFQLPIRNITIATTMCNLPFGRKMQPYAESYGGWPIRSNASCNPHVAPASGCFYSFLDNSNFLSVSRCIGIFFKLRAVGTSPTLPNVVGHFSRTASCRAAEVPQFPGSQATGRYRAQSRQSRKLQRRCPRGPGNMSCALVVYAHNPSIFAMDPAAESGIVRL